MQHRGSTNRRFAVLATATLSTFWITTWGGCSRHEQANRESLDLVRTQPLFPPEMVTDSFERLTADEIGINFIHYWTPPPEYEEIIDRSFAGGGVAIGDFDQDGRADIYLTRPFGGGRLYRNWGDFRFDDATARAGLGTDATWSCGPSFVDIDNDQDLDLFVCGYDCPNRLFVNQGDGTFVEEASKRGLAFTGASVMMAFADYDSDGDMDGYLVTNRFVSEADSARLKKQLAQGRKFVTKKGNHVEILPEARELMAVFPEPVGDEIKLIQAGQFGRLYRNEGDGSFVEVSQSAGVVDNGLSLAATWWDYNHDGHPDLYVANDFYGADRLFHNNGDGTFTDVVKETLPHTPWFSMGCNVADINNDGLLDFMGSDMSGTSHYKSKIGMGDMTKDAWFMDLADPPQTMRNSLYVNTGTRRFLEVAQMAGIADSDWTWCLKFGDFDCDGFSDLFITNGMTGDWLNSDILARATLEGREVRPDEVAEKRDPHLAFRNLGDLQFTNVGASWGLDEAAIGFGAAMGDLDNDGDLDLVVNNFGEAPGIFRNQLVCGNRVTIALRGTLSNTHGIDSLVTMEAGPLKQAFYVTLARGFMGCDQPVVHFGLGDLEQIDKLTIRWPSGTEQTIESLAANLAYTIREPSVTANAGRPHAKAATMFVRSERMAPLQASHEELEYDDFERQPLLPNRLSRLGPGIALGDVNGDAATDVFVGGAAGQPASLLIQRDGQFVGSEGPLGGPFQDDWQSEDMGCVLLDVDRDGDLDLYVVSGGIECEPGDEVLRDRLYLNDGRGGFSRSEGDSLPDLRDSGSCVAASDFDRDGDVDLFIGARSIPGSYPAIPRSRILRNDSSADRISFVDATQELAPHLLETGLVTSALWSDADGDGWLDLLVAHEWGPIKLFRNQQGKLVETTQAAGLAKRLGWWNGITGRDVDGDGDMDYAVTNFGLNTKYHPTSKTPVAIFFADFENRGRDRIVEAKKHGDHYLPVRGKSCSQNAMPFLKDKFPTYHEFALAELADIYSHSHLNKALRFEVNCLSSGLLINDGQARFEFRPFPRLAQVSPAFGVQFADVDADGFVDLYLVQNFFGPQRETGRMDGGLSLLLRGHGDGTFTPVAPRTSGLVVHQDAKSLAGADVTGDGRIDFVVGVNNEPLQLFENHTTAGRTLRVELRSKDGGRQLAGARVTLLMKDGTRQTAEAYCGEGYLTQAPPEIVFGLGDRLPQAISVRWPDGEILDQELGDGFENHIVIQRK